MDSRLVASESRWHSFSTSSNESSVAFVSPAIPPTRDSLLKLADEYAARASDLENASENDDATVWQAGSDDKDAD
jgi:hypothetical protein